MQRGGSEGRAQEWDALIVLLAAKLAPVALVPAMLVQVGQRGAMHYLLSLFAYLFLLH